MVGSFRSIETTRRFVVYIGVNWSQEVVPVSLWQNDMVDVQHFYFDELPTQLISRYFPIPLISLPHNRNFTIYRAKLVVFHMEDPYTARYYTSIDNTNMRLPPDFA